jgi:hypothetical protein
VHISRALLNVAKAKKKLAFQFYYNSMMETYFLSPNGAIKKMFSKKSFFATMIK